jgi:hypothetical protein
MARWPGYLEVCTYLDALLEQVTELTLVYGYIY